MIKNFPPLNVGAVADKNFPPLNVGAVADKIAGERKVARRLNAEIYNRPIL